MKRDRDKNRKKFLTSYLGIQPQICGYVDREVLEHMARNGLSVDTSNLD